MALVLSGERPAAAASSLNPIRMVANWFAQLRANPAHDGVSAQQNRSHQ